MDSSSTKPPLPPGYIAIHRDRLYKIWMYLQEYCFDDGSPVHGFKSEELKELCSEIARELEQPE